MINFLEQLVAEWYEFNGYFVRRNVRVGRRTGGGYDGELDVVALHPGERKLVHIEPSMDASSWDKRQQRFARKFELGRTHIPTLFAGVGALPPVDQIALIGFGSAPGRLEVGGGRLLLIADFMRQIREDLQSRSIAKSAIPEQFYLLRTLQFAATHWR